MNLKKIYLLAFYCLLGFFGVSSCSSPVPDISSKMIGFDTEVDSLMNLYHTVGVSVAIIKDGEIAYSNGFGYSDLENSTPATANTVYGIASCSKSFTASLFGILASNDQLKLTDMPKQHIPSLKFYNTEMNQQIQLRHILSHSTGLPNVSTESSAVLFRSENKNDIIPRLQYLAPQAGVEEEWIYNNYMYALAGRITEHITQQSWQENLSEYIFDPLEMSSSFGNVTPASKHPAFALGYGVRRNDTTITRVLKEDFPTRDAGGNIYSSVNDMTRWLRLWLNEGQLQGEEFLPKEYVNAAMGEQHLISTDSLTNESRYYGYGWMRSRQEGHLKIEHSGGISGYTSNMVFFPEDDIGIVVLSNQNTAGIAFALTNNLITRMLDIEIAPHPNEPYFSTVIEIEDPSKNTVIQEDNPPTHSLDQFTGSFFRQGFGTINVTYDDGTLYAEFPFTTFRLEHQENNTFIDYFTERKSQVMGNFLTFDFQANSEEIIDRLLLNIDTEPVPFQKKEKGL